MRIVATLGLLLVLPCCLLLIACGALADNCEVSALVIPATATADPAAAAPGNQVQFSTSFTVKGSCVLPQFLTEGQWVTSDPTNTSISNQPPTVGVATCLHPAGAIITYTGTRSGYGFTPASLTCK